jgi:cytidine deaminase
LSIDAGRLVAAARDAARHAYAPYSHYHVGAALLMTGGDIITAANVENASYGLSLCAETAAIAKAASEGRMADIAQIAVAGGMAAMAGTAGAVTPCGRCRQFIKEAADVSGRDIPVHCAHRGGYDTYLLSELLPHAFGPSNLKISGKP